MIEITNLQKKFGRQQVLRGIDLKVENGKIYAVLGPNGSGKTTLIKSILGLVIPDAGDIYINKKNVKNGAAYRKQIGYMPQIAQFPENLNMMELFRMVQDVRKEKAAVEPWLHYFKLKGAEHKLLKHLSGGMKQKVNAILSLMFDPEILIFDEPSVGLDPIAHIKLKEKILEQKSAGKAILITTHIMSEVDELADDIIFLLEGKVYFNGSKEDLKADYDEEKLDRAIAKMMESFEKSSKIAEYV